MGKRWQDKSPEVSIVVIFCNAERFFEEALESVLAQTHRPTDVHLVDDGSSDGSTLIGKDFASRFPFIHYHEHEGHTNRGMSASRNLGLAACSGRFVSFLDADDVWLPNKLESELALFNSHPEAAMVCSATELWFSWTSDPAERSHLALHRSDDPIQVEDQMRLVADGAMEGLVQPPSLVFRHLRRRDGLPKITGALCRRWAALKVGGFEKNFSPPYEDQVFFTKMALRFPVYVTQDCYARYRQHRLSACQQARVAAARDVDAHRIGLGHARYLLWLAAYLETTHPHMGRLRELIRSRLERISEAEARRASESLASFSPESSKRDD